MSQKLTVLTPNKAMLESAREILDRAIAQEPDEVVVVCFKAGGYNVMGSKTLSVLQQVGALEALKAALLEER